MFPKRWIAALLAAVLTVGMLAFPASAEPASTPSSAQIAEERTASLQFEWNGSDFDAAKLTDGKTSTKQTTAESDLLVLTSAEPLGGIYLIFDRPTDEYTVTAAGQEIAVDTGFLHQWVPFAEGVTAVTVTLPGNTLCEVSAWSEGEPPAERVQQWLPPYEDCDMLLLPTHADDDQLWFGAAMATAAAEGRKVQVAYLTHHWSEPYRPHELLNGLWQSGVRAYPVIPEFPDYYSESLEHAKTLYDVDAMLDYTVGLLRRFSPEVVIGHDLEGEYGHGVHRLNAWLLTEALEQSGDPACYPDSAALYGTFDVPKTYLHLYPENKLTLEIDTPLPALGGRTAFEVAQDGYACHVSQQQYWFKVFRSGMYSCREFGLYRTTVGADSGIGDLFENITVFSDAVSSEPESSEPESSEPSEPSSAEISSAAESTASDLQPDAPSSDMIGDGIWYALGGLLLAVIALGILLAYKSRKK